MLTLKVFNFITNPFIDYIVSVSQSKRYLFSYQMLAVDDANPIHYVNIIDIQNERVITKLKLSKASLKRRRGVSSTNKKVS